MLSKDDKNWLLSVSREDHILVERMFMRGSVDTLCKEDRDR